MTSIYTREYLTGGIPTGIHEDEGAVVLILDIRSRFALYVGDFVRKSRSMCSTVRRSRLQNRYCLCSHKIKYD